MAFPGINITVENGNLLRAMTILDGVPGWLTTVSTPELIGVVKEIYSLTDAEKQGYTETAEPFAYRQLKEYYNELGGNQRLILMGVAETATMADMLTVSNTNGAIKLLGLYPEVSLLAVSRKPAASYNAGTALIDTDVQAAVTAGKTLCQNRQSKNLPLRVFVEGRVADETKANTFTPNTSENGYVAVVLGGTAPDKSAAVSLALARAVKYPAHVKLGSGQNGALSVLQLYLGTKKIEERSDMETLHDAGFLTFHSRPGTAGYYFGRDNMCTADDFRILAHGRITDKAQRIAAAAYAPYVEHFVRLNPDGSINENDASYLEKVAEQAIRAAMGTQISDVKVVIDPAQNIVNNSTLRIEIKVLPLGYLTWISVALGLTTQTA